jgi:hypothetical protein
MISNKKTKQNNPRDEIMEDIQSKLSSKTMDFYTSDELFKKNIKKVQKEFKRDDAYTVEYLCNEKRDESFVHLEPYRTKISNINFVIINIIQKLIDEPSHILTTRTIYETVTENISIKIEGYLIKYELIKNKKIKKIRLKICNNKKKLKNLRVLLHQGSQLVKNNISKEIEEIEEKINDLKAICEKLKNPKKNKAKVLENKVEFSSDGSKELDRKARDIIHNSLKYLSSYNIIKKVKGRDEYKLNIEHWFEYTDYSIRSKKMLKNILPLLIAFLKYNAPNRVDDFLKYFHEITWALLSTPSNMSDYANIENYILKRFEKDVKNISFRVLDKDTDEELDKRIDFINVIPLQIIIIENSVKVLKFFDENKDKIYEIKISKIFRLIVVLNTDKSIYIKSDKKSYIYNDALSKYIRSKEYKEQRETYALNTNFTYGHKINTLLESDTNMLDFYQNTLLKNIKIFSTQSEKMYLFKEYIDDYFSKESAETIGKIKTHIERKLYNGNKIYTIIEDTDEDEILNLVLKGESVNIIYPFSLQKKYINILNKKNTNALDFS